MSGLIVDGELLQEIAARLDLREPNREALESIAIEMSQYYDVLQGVPPFEAVIDVATGVGKTYILAAAIDYLATARGTRNMAIITPGRTILRKTLDNFTAGGPKSLVDGMIAPPVVITAETFNTAAMRAVMDDPDQVKLYIFTVQALTKPETATGRRTHKFQEGLGQAFYAHLQTCDDLVVFADEHHAYYGTAFSRTVRELRPQALIGLTATPHKQTPPDQIIYRYPLAAAIADRLVKTPVIVGRRDDRADVVTKLLDGVRLLECKRDVLARYAADSGASMVNPVMLVIARDIEEANEVEGIITAPSFAGGILAGRVLTVHSSAPDEALAALETVEEPDSPVRVIISVGMLKEGWDVKNVYVIASLRASVSELLTEQTMGRGLRLPFGKYTNIEILDTLEILAHERYEELLRKASVLNKSFIDSRTRAAMRRNSQGDLVATRETREVDARLAVDDGNTQDEGTLASYGEVARPTFGGPIVISAPHRIQEADETLKLAREFVPRKDAPIINIPRLVMTMVHSTFSLADITDLHPFRQAGAQLAADPASYLRRVATSAQIVQGRDGLRYTRVVTAPAVDLIQSQASLLPIEDAIDKLRERVLSAAVVPARSSERRAAEPLIQEFLAGLGDKAQPVLSTFLDRAAGALIGLVTTEQRRVAKRPQYDEVLALTPFMPKRTTTRPMDLDRFGAFSKSVSYGSWHRGLFAEAWFDSEPERAVANIVDEAEEVHVWARLEIGDLPILWGGAGQNYNPDFLVIEHDDTHWIIEVKADKDMTASDVVAKREAARRWANHVSADEQVGVQWRYLLVSQGQVEGAHGSWTGLRALGR